MFNASTLRQIRVALSTTRLRAWFVALSAAALFLAEPTMVQGSPIKADEDVILFPTTAYLDQAAGQWVIPFHGWIFEPEEDSIWRAALVSSLVEALEVDENSVEQELFRTRARMFLVDNERGKRLVARIGGQGYAVAASTPNGHIRDVARIARSRVQVYESRGWAPVEIVMPERDRRRFRGAVWLAGPTGLSVISDIDDTIKVSNVTDKEALLANTFLRPFRAVPGMAETYRRWAAAGAAFHYLSASPWQLYPAISSFLAEQDFPDGSYHLKTFRLKDRTFFDLFGAPEAYKVPLIEGLLRNYPGRRFLLIGDSSEKDPEIYAAVAARYPEQVAHIFIRDVGAAASSGDRFTRIFQAMPPDRWTVFRDARELLEVSLEPDAE